jgi:type II secretory pathway component PulF
VKARWRWRIIWRRCWKPALLIVTGVIIGTLVVAMYLPIFHLGDAMSGMG